MFRFVAVVADACSEVACAIRALRPEFTHIDKNPFLHSSAVSMTQGVPVSRVTPTRLVPPVAPRYPLSPPESVIAPIPVAPRSSRPDKFLFWYIGAPVTSQEDSADVIRPDWLSHLLT